MANPDGLDETLRIAMAVPTDTMITLDLPLLLTKLAQLPAVAPSAPVTDTDPPARALDGGQR